MSRALVVGASGQVGSALVEALGPARSRGTYLQRPIEGGIRLSLAECAQDATALEAHLRDHDIDVVYIAAALSHVDGCEERPAEALRLNCDAPAAIARAATAVGARTVLFSTEYVFDGRTGPYSEDDVVAPVSVYGRSKVEGERAVLGVDAEALVIRTTVVYGPEHAGKNFAYRVATTLAAGNVLRVPGDQISSPTYSRDLAAASIALVADGARGVFNVVGPETMDRAEFARRLAGAAGLVDDTVEAIATEDLGQLAERPKRAGLTIDKLLTALPATEMRTVEAAAAHWIEHQRGKPWPTT